MKTRLLITYHVQELHDKMVLLRKNRVLEELAQTMISEISLPKYLLLVTKRQENQYLLFLCVWVQCFILNNGKDNLSKFDAKYDEGIFQGSRL